MALAPKRVMHRKVQRGRQHGFATRDNYIDFGDIALVAMEPTWLDARVIEAARVAINRKLELSRLINKVSNPKERAILRMTYILKQYPEDVMEHLKISQTTYYRLRKHATEELDIFLEAWE